MKFEDKRKELDKFIKLSKKKKDPGSIKHKLHTYENRLHLSTVYIRNKTDQNERIKANHRMLEEHEDMLIKEMKSFHANLKTLINDCCKALKIKSKFADPNAKVKPEKIPAPEPKPKPKPEVEEKSPTTT